MIRWLSQVGIGLLALVATAAACAANETSLRRVEPDASGSDSSLCTQVGCSLAPCGQQCTDPCGCCPNDNCANDAQADSDGSHIGDGGNDGGGCGLALAWETGGTLCQGWADQNCCQQQQACSNESVCSTFVKCVAACPTPRQDACVNACGAPPPSLDGFATCTKQVPPAVAASIPDECRWP